MGSSGMMFGGVGTGGSGPPTTCAWADCLREDAYAGESADEAE